VSCGRPQNMRSAGILYKSFGLVCRQDGIVLTSLGQPAVEEDNAAN
jgi:hypothetical protein